MKLPDSIERYFTAANDFRIEDAAACFSSDATVHDEDADHHGTGEIREWIAETISKYRPKVEMLRTEEIDGRPLVTARVSGNFPGSPVELEYEFSLQDGTISNLVIQ